MESYIFENPAKTVFGEVSKKLNRIVKNIPTEVREQQVKNNLGSIAVKRYQRNSQSFPITELTFESKLEYQLAVSHGIHIFNVHFKVEPNSAK